MSDQSKSSGTAGKRFLLVSDWFLTVVLALFSFAFESWLSSAEVHAEEPDAAMIRIPAGVFLMGSLEGGSNERPRHEVHVDGFLRDSYEVTNALYLKFVEESGREVPFFVDDPDFNGPEQPIVGVTWDDANAFCGWMGKRLPTETEWEKAASWDEKKAEKLTYPWGNGAPLSGTRYLANCQPTSPGRIDADGYPFTAPVGQYHDGRSPYGVHDKAGNVADWYADDYYAVSPLPNPNGSLSGRRKVLRGGSWGSVAYAIRSSYRAHEVPGEIGDLNGFRCAK